MSMFVISCLDVIRLHSSNNTFYVYRRKINLAVWVAYVMLLKY